MVLLLWFLLLIVTNQKYGGINNPSIKIIKRLYPKEYSLFFYG